MIQYLHLLGPWLHWRIAALVILHPERFNRLRLSVELHVSVRSRPLRSGKPPASRHPFNRSPLLLHTGDLTLLPGIPGGNIILNCFVVLSLIWINSDYSLLLLMLARPVLLNLNLGHRRRHCPACLDLGLCLMVDWFHDLRRLRVPVYPADILSSIFRVLGNGVTTADAVGQEIVGLHS